MKLIQDVADYIEEHYLFPDVGRKLADHLRHQDYSGLSDAKLGKAVTADMIGFTNDQHFFLHYDPEEAAGNQDHEALMRQHTEKARFQNFGFYKIERLAGNIGYFQLNELPPVFIAGKMLHAAMILLSNTSAIILDLGQCGGGTPEMVQGIASYFVIANQPLSGIEGRGGEKYQEWKTLEIVEGQRILDKPLAILISKETFSAAEALAYDLQILKRATIIGESSHGGAHLSDFQAFDGQFVLRCPIARALNPITQSNWEGTGVFPDIVSDTALLSAQKYLLDTLIKQGESPDLAAWEAARAELG